MNPSSIVNFFFLLDHSFGYQLPVRRQHVPVTQVAQEIASTLTQLLEVSPESPVSSSHLSSPFLQGRRLPEPDACFPYQAPHHPHMDLTDTNCLAGPLLTALLCGVLPAGCASYQAQLCPQHFLLPQSCALWDGWPGVKLILMSTLLPARAFKIRCALLRMNGSL